jgi:hypothetical protein
MEFQTEKVDFNNSPNRREELEFSTWINTSGELKAVMVYRTGNCHAQRDMSIEQAREVIQALENHITNVQILQQQLAQQSA